MSDNLNKIIAKWSQIYKALLNRNYHTIGKKRSELIDVDRLAKLYKLILYQDLKWKSR